MRVKNTSKKQVNIWWGHTPYQCLPGEVVDLPDEVARSIKGHNDYKMLKPVGEEHGEGIHEAELQDVDKAGKDASASKEGVGPKGVDEKVHVEKKPWDDPKWDVEAADESVLREYAIAYNLKIAKNISSEDLRDVVYEHYIA